MPAYLQWVEQTLISEQELLKECLDLSTQPKLLKILHYELISVHIKTLLWDNYFS